MKTNLKSIKDKFQMSMFPGKLSSLKGEEAPRLKSTVAITIVDRVTGEVMKRTIPFECNETDDLVDWIRSVLTHNRTEGDIESFTKGRSS